MPAQEEKADANLHMKTLDAEGSQGTARHPVEWNTKYSKQRPI